MKKFAWLFRIIVLIGLIVFMFWRCRYGFANIDEAFHLHMAYRLWQGDALLVDCWDLQQMFGVLLLPVMWLYMKLVGSTDGIFLNFRYLYATVMILTASLHYWRWRNINDRGAFWGSVAYMLSAPFTVLSMTYNSTGVICFSLAITLLATNDTRRSIDYFLAGWFYAMAILCTPFLVLLYPMFSIAFLYRKKCVKGWISVTVSCVICLAILTVFIFSRANIHDILLAVPNYFTDPAHANRSILIMLRDWGGHLLLVQGVWSFVPMMLMGCVVAFQLRLDREADKRYGMYACIYALIGLVLMLVALFVRCWIDFFMLPACILALACSLKLPDVKCRTIALQCVVPTFAYAFCICLGSNQGSYLIASVMAAGIVPAFVLLFCIFDQFVKPVSKGWVQRFALILMPLIMIVQITGETVARYQKVWWDEPIGKLDFKFEKGPERGIITSVKIGKWCDSLIRMAREDLLNGDGKMVLFYPASLWQYFAGPWRVGSYSAWISDLDSSNSEADHMSRLVRFFELNPSKMPDIVSVASSDYRTVSKFIDKYGYQIKRIGEDRIVLTQSGVGK